MFFRLLRSWVVCQQQFLINTKHFIEHTFSLFFLGSCRISFGTFFCTMWMCLFRGARATKATLRSMPNTFRFFFLSLPRSLARSRSRSLLLSLSLALFRSRSCSRSCSHTRFLSLSLSLTLALSHSGARSHSHSRAVSLALALAFALSLSRACALSLSLSPSLPFPLSLPDFSFLSFSLPGSLYFLSLSFLPYLRVCFPFSFSLTHILTRSFSLSLALSLALSFALLCFVLLMCDMTHSYASHDLYTQHLHTSQPQLCMSRVSHFYKSAMSHVCMGHVKYKYSSSHTYEWVMSHI